MKTNEKKSLRLLNNTKYFDETKDRTHVEFGSPETYQYRQIKIEGYETRLYWQYRYGEDHNGQTFFYTLTYSDENIPKYMGKNCFDYEDLTDFLTGGFRKQLLRKYGSTFKYFIGAELGDGKGQRGLANNPHYHFLFFVLPANNPRYPYRKILPEQFRHLVRKYWQGFDQDTDGFHDFRTSCKYGIAKEGEPEGFTDFVTYGRVIGFQACTYCSKYVCKDAGLKAHEDKIRRKLFFKYKNTLRHSPEFARWFYDNYLFPKYDIEIQNEDPIVFAWTVRYLVNEHDEWCEWEKHYMNFVDKKVKLAINEYRNRYCNKCRISQGVGDYALDFVEDLLDPRIEVPSKKGMKARPISMYYYRKLYTEVIKDWTGSNIRVLTPLGIDYKVARLPKQLKKKEDTALAHFNQVYNSRGLFNLMRNSDINTGVFFSYDEFLRDTNYLLNVNNINNIVKRYAEYKLVYEDRYFALDELDEVECDSFPTIAVERDYRRFLVPSIFSVSRSNHRLTRFLENDCQGMLPYYSHPYFLRYLRIFAVLDMCADYFFVQKDDKDQKEAEERAAVKRFHDKRKLDDFYANFR